MNQTNSKNPSNHKTPRAVLFKSKERFAAFQKKLDEYGVNTTVLNFKTHDWLEYDYSEIDFVIYYPSFEYSSNHPLALHDVYDNLMYIHSEYPNIKLFPDPNIIKYYNDKYRQFLFLSKHTYPIPETVPLLSEASLDIAERQLGFPMVIKNRYGAGGNSVFRVADRKELQKLYNISTLNLFNSGAVRYFGEMISKRIFYYHLIKEKRSQYPFLSPPLLAQKYVKIDRDLKTVTGNGRVVEGHWRIQSDESMWKMNIDGGGTGVWSEIPQEAIDLSISLARDLKTTWLNIDMIISNGKFLITEFSPVWHHYAYQEKPSFVYKDDYNLDPLEISLDLERIIVESLIERVKSKR